VPYRPTLPPTRRPSGVDPEVYGGSPIFPGPVTPVTSGDRSILPGEVRSGAPGFLEAVNRVGGLRLDEYAAVGGPIEFRVPWWPETLHLVPDESHGGALVAEGVARHRVLLPAELAELVRLGHRPGDLSTLMEARKALGGDVVSVMPRRGTEASDEPPAGGEVLV
jgi:hypothetical protein